MNMILDAQADDVQDLGDASGGVLRVVVPPIAALHSGEAIPQQPISR